MGKTKPKESAQSPKRMAFQDWSNTKYVLNNLTEAQLSEMDALPFDFEKYSEWVEHLITNQGMSVKLDWDNFSFCYKAVLMGAWHGFPNAGYAVSARSDSVVDAFKILWYKYELIAEGDLPSYYEQVPKGKRRG